MDVVNKNWLSITSPLKTHTYGGITIDIAEDGMFTINGTVTRKEMAGFYMGNWR